MCFLLPTGQARFHAMAEAHGHAQEIRGQPLIVTETISERRKRRKRESQLELLSTTSPVPVPQKEEKVDWSNNKLGATMLLLPALPTVDQWNAVINAAKPSIVLSGTAAVRQSGPLIGLVDIGTCEDAYLFRTALPGVKKDDGTIFISSVSQLSSIFWV